MGTMAQLRSRLKTTTALSAQLQTLAGVELIAVAWGDVARQLGCAGDDLKLIARGLAFGLIEKVTVRFIDTENFDVGEVQMVFDPERLAIDVEGNRVDLDPDQPITPQISRGLSRIILGVRRQFEGQGAVRRECLVTFSDDIYADEARLAESRRVLGVAAARKANYGEWERVRAGRLTPGRMTASSFTVYGRGQKRRRDGQDW